MIRIHTLFIGQPREITDAQGTWESAICRTPVEGSIELGLRGLAGDRVADTAHHGSPGQAVCCHPLSHYDLWNAEYGLDTPERRLGPGSVGENWTLPEITEADVCAGDTFSVGTARVQVSGPRYPCWKQERKLGLPGFLKRTMETMRTGFYVRVLTPGVVQSGNELSLEARPHPGLTMDQINGCIFRELDPEVARRGAEAEELAPFWREFLRKKLASQ